MAPTRIAIAVVQRANEFLIGRRPPGTALAGMWEFPGGKVEPQETAQEAARRECREETGLDVVVVGEYPEHVHHYQHDCVRLSFFACCPIDASQQPDPRFHWVAREALTEYSFPDGNLQLLELLKNQSIQT